MEQQPAKSSKEQWEAHIESLVQGLDLDDMKGISTRDVMASVKEKFGADLDSVDRAWVRSATQKIVQRQLAYLHTMVDEFGEGEGLELQLVGEPQQKERPKTLDAS